MSSSLIPFASVSSNAKLSITHTKKVTTTISNPKFEGGTPSPKAPPSKRLKLCQSWSE